MKTTIALSVLTMHGVDTWSALVAVLVGALVALVLDRSATLKPAEAEVPIFTLAEHLVVLHKRHAMKLTARGIE